MKSNDLIIAQLKAEYGVYCFIEKKTDRVLYIGKDSNIFTILRKRKHLDPKNKSKQKINTYLQENPDK
jgi:hypothetical protein